jgi:hypothetical protein
MNFNIGIAIYQEPGSYYVASAIACTPYAIPILRKSNSISYIQAQASATAIVQLPSLRGSVNAVANRVIEELFIRGLIDTENLPQVTLIVPRNLKKEVFYAKSQYIPYHWIQKASQQLLALWLQGGHV